MVIYLVTNKINGLKYIGQTIKTLEERKNQHIKNALRGSKYHFHRAIKKYGPDNFEWEVLEGVVSVDDLNYLEIYYIEKYNTFIGEGYNSTKGGHGCSGWKHSEETKRIIGEKSKEQIRKPLTNEQRKKLSDFQKDKTLVERWGEEKANKMIEQLKLNYVERYGEIKANEIKKKQSENSYYKTDSFKKLISSSCKKRLDINGKRTDITENGRILMSNSKLKSGNPNYVEFDNAVINEIISEYKNNGFKVTKQLSEMFNISIYLIRRILKDNQTYKS
jgi:group I intron endonuclease